MAKNDLGEKDGANQVQASNMETVETEAQITPESQNNSTIFNEVISSNPNLSTCHINPVDFDVQIQEIDVALGKYDSCENYVGPNLIDTSLTLANNAATIIPSQPAHILISQEQVPPVAETSFNPAKRTLRTWKKLARESTMETETSQGPTTTKRSREEDLELLPELPTKKLQVSMEVGQQNTMAEAAQQPRQA